MLSFVTSIFFPITWRSESTFQIPWDLPETVTTENADPAEGIFENEKKKGHILFIPLQRNDEDSELPGHTGYVVTLLPEADQLRIIATTDEAAEAKEETLRSHTHEVCQTFQPSATILRKGDVRSLTPNIPLSKMWIFPEFKAYLPLKPKPLPVLYLEHNGSWGYSLMLECWDTGFNSHPH